MQSIPLDHIRVLRVTPGQGGAIVVDKTSVGPRLRHFAKKLSGGYEARCETGYLHNLYPGHAVRFILNGDDDYPIDPRVPFWRLPELDFKIWGTGLIFKFKSTLPADCEVDFTRFMSDIVSANQGRPRKSALLRGV